MEKLIMTISASKDSFGAYSENCDGIWAAGNTIEACKSDVLKAIEAFKNNLPEDRWPEPIRGKYEIIWKYDTESFMLYYGSMLSLAGLERITGINQKQLWAYMHGRSKPRPVQKQRITDSLHAFARELAESTIL